MERLLAPATAEELDSLDLPPAGLEAEAYTPWWST